MRRRKAIIVIKYCRWENKKNRERVQIKRRKAIRRRKRKKEKQMKLIKKKVWRKL